MNDDQLKQVLEDGARLRKLLLDSWGIAFPPPDGLCLHLICDVAPHYLFRNNMLNYHCKRCHRNWLRNIEEGWCRCNVNGERLPDFKWGGKQL